MGLRVPLVLLLCALVTQAPPPDALFEIALPWDDGSPTAIDVSGTVSRVIPDDGFVRTTADGHLSIKDRRVRFWGVTLTNSANFPEKPDAERVARRLAKLGVNIVRFDQLDAHDIWTSVDPDRGLDPGQLDRLDYFVAQLKRNGIYSDLSLLASRPFSRQATSLPADLDLVTNVKRRAALGFFDDALLQLQKDYARDLLMHVNAYTGNPYAQEPAVAFVEINRENGLVDAFLSGQLDNLPPFYKQELTTQWNRWLRGKYANHDALIAGWSDAGNGVSFYPDEMLGSKTGMRAFLRKGDAVARSENARKDWFRFLWQTEDRYWRGMRDHLKSTLGLKALVLGTVVGSSTPNLMASFDAIEAQAFWRPPTFPGKPEDPANWFVKNDAMVNHPDASTVAGLAMRHVLNKPLIVSAYNHPHPNTFEAEAFPFIATYAALQDFDAVFAYAYAADKQFEKAPASPADFYSLRQNPLKMATFIPSAIAFLRGDISPARDRAVVTLARESEQTWLMNAQPGQLVDAKTAGVDPLESLSHRIAIAVEGQSVPSDAVHPRAGAAAGAARAAGGQYLSDTGQVRWDVSQPMRGVVSVDTPGTKLLYGFIGDRTFELSGVTIHPKMTMQQGFAVIGVSSMDAVSIGTAMKLVITAVGTGTSTGAAWLMHPSTPIVPTAFPPPEGINLTHGQQWGRAPFQVEGIGATITLPFPATRVHVWALDATGARARDVPITATPGGGAAVVTIQPDYKALWYEVQVRSGPPASTQMR